LNCDLIAPWYRWLEYGAFGRELERRRRHFLSAASRARRALVLGDGDGRFLARLIRGNSQLRADYVDSSARMLALARRRAGEDRVTYRHADARAFVLPAGEYDFVATHFFFDCFEEHDGADLARRVAAGTTDDAVWLVSEFRQPRWAPALLRGLYLFFRVTTGLRTRRLVDHRPLLAQCGFRLAEEHTSRLGLLASEMWVKA
jgi:SAM-dependent methyltransferase